MSLRHSSNFSGRSLNAASEATLHPLAAPSPIRAFPPFAPRNGQSPRPRILPGLSAFETGTPTFLINLLAETGIPWHCLDGLRASEALLSTFDVGRIAPEALLFQTGYLTVVDGESRGGRLPYQLGYPNREVRESLNRALLDDLLGSGFEREERETRLLEVPEAAHFDGMRDLLRSLLAGIPHQFHARNPMAVTRAGTRACCTRTSRPQART